MNNIITNNTEKCEKAAEGLYHVDDPEIGLNVVDLGLIYQIDFNEEGKQIYCEMTLTTQFCPMGESINSNITESLKESYPGWNVDVHLTFDPPWDYSKISAKGNEFLGR